MALRGQAGLLLIAALLVAPTVARGQGFEGFGFGPAIVSALDIAGPRRIDEALIDSAGYTRAVREETAIVRFGLETHFFLPLTDQLGIGPFVAALPGDMIIQGIAAGVMIGFRRDAAATASFNLGMGGMVIPRARTLAPEFYPLNTPAPLGSNGPLPLRYVEYTQTALVVVFSASWSR